VGQCSYSLPLYDNTVILS